ncbi:MAG: hypothetical protein U9Q97_01960 [Acidobacteriota bacterium]|nr:hypothetical protein [Acidobacteriota bacterium]
MLQETIKIEEEVGRGTRGGPYVYLVDSLELVHISEYAIRESPGRGENQIIYELPSSVEGKVAYAFHFSRSGGAFLTKGRIEDIGNYDKCKHGLIEEFIPELRQLKFRIREIYLRTLSEQFGRNFAHIIGDLKAYTRKLDFKYGFMGHQSRLENAFENPEVYYFTFMSLPKDRSRIKSLKVTRRWIYQLWVLKLLCDALQVSKFKGHEYGGKPYWWIEQGSDYSTGMGETPFGDVTFWLEFQPSKGAHVLGAFDDGFSRSEFKKAKGHVRPDIIAVKGHFEETKDFTNSGKAIDALIECKEDPFDKWKNEIESQILPYQDYFKSRYLIIASLEPIPHDAKRYLENQGMKVVDNLKPNGETIRTLYDAIRRGFE